MDIEGMRVKLTEIAARRCWSDGDTDKDPFIVDDYAGGNIDDAYEGGVRDGATGLAREFLAEFFGGEAKA